MRNIAVFIGRFQPLHFGHIDIINKMLDENELTIIVIGSKNKSDDRNPFSYETRQKFIKSIYPSSNLIVVGLDDYNDNETWCNTLDKLILDHIFFDITESKIRLYGPKKDESTRKYIDYVLENSKIREYVECNILFKEGKILDATLIRQILKNDIDNFEERVKDYLPEKIINIILSKN